MSYLTRWSHAGFCGERSRAVVVCDGCRREKRVPTLTKLPEGWTEVPPSSTLGPTKHYCPKCSKKRAKGS